MSFKGEYYTGYEEDDDSSIADEDLNDSKSEDEYDNELLTCLNSKKDLPVKTKPNKKVLSNMFEEEMSKELDNFIEMQEKKYASVFSGEEQTAKTSKDVEMENMEESDTDSEAEMETGVRTKKKRQHFTNDELFYDPNADEEDQEWINKQRKTCKKFLSPAKQSPQTPKSILKPTTSEPVPKVEKYTDARTDAILNCPCCMTMLCMDCQRHEKYKTQFRAMFVFNCNIKQDEQLKYPKPKGNAKKKQNNQSDQVEEEFDLFKPVECKGCKVEVGVYDPKEEMYHFFNVLASHS